MTGLLENLPDQAARNALLPDRKIICKKRAEPCRTGISAGILISAAVLNLGIKGSLLCLVGLFPQFLLYIPAYVVLLWYCYTAPQTRWNRQKTIFVSLAMSVGILLEIYINPIIVKAFLSVL